ncbi:MAG: hypothetical protein IJ794_18850 [Lachnospiraceae bacterium]|nr:hypothetical protein [Lachnospiraceae bacterium]
MRKESLEYLMSSAQVPQIVEEKIDEALRRIQEMDSEQWEANLVKRGTTLGGQKVNPVKQDMNSVIQETNLKQQETNLKQSEKENEHMRKKKFLLPFASVAAGLLFCSVTALGAWNFVQNYLSPAQVAEELGKTKLSAVYAGEDSLIEPMTQSADGYEFTLLGMVNGDAYELFDGHVGYVTEEAHDESFIVLAISKTDGTPMPEDEDPEYDHWQFDINTYMQGYDPKWYNGSSTGAGISCWDKVIDGVRYYVVTTRNLEYLADKKVYFGIRSNKRQVARQSNAFLVDETTGEIYINPEYDKLAVLFELPLNPSKADPEKKEEMLNAWK